MENVVKARLAFSSCIRRVEDVLFTVEATAVSDKGNISVDGYYNPDLHGDIIGNLVLVFNVPFVVQRVRVSPNRELDGYYPYKALLVLRPNGWTYNE
jgi:hypothetical protein